MSVSSEKVEELIACSRWEIGWSGSDDVPVDHVAKAIKRGKVDPTCTPPERLAQAVEKDLLEMDDFSQEIRSEVEEEIEESTEESSDSAEEPEQEQQTIS